MIRIKASTELAGLRQRYMLEFFAYDCIGTAIPHRSDQINFVRDQLAMGWMIRMHPETAILTLGPIE